MSFFVFNYSHLIDPFLKDLRKFVVKFSEVGKEEKVLDVCCGTGDQIFHFAKVSAFAVGIDKNPQMIDFAKKIKERRKIRNVHFEVASATNLPFKDSTFDLALISLALHEIESKERNLVISEMKRVVKKEKSLIFVDFQVPLPKNIFSFFIQKIEHFAGKEHYLNFKNFLQEGGLKNLMAKNKLKIEKEISFKNNLLTIIKAKNFN